MVQLIIAFISTALVSLLLHYFVFKQYGVDAIDENNKDDKILNKQIKEDNFSPQNVLMSKWMAFGGGFYGVVAVLTYIVVEFREVVDFFTSEGSLVETIVSLGIGDLVNLFINSIMNFVTAISWPAYWLNKTEGHSAWVWFLVVYSGYLTGQFFAKNAINPYEEGHDDHENNRDL